MKVQVLVAAMHQIDHSLLEKMNIQSDVIIGNQCNKNSIEKFKYKGNQVIYLNFKERGVGLNRNNALMRATGDICLFADDDMIYVDNYVEIVMNAFLKHLDADVIVFNLVEKVSTRFVITKEKKIGYLNYLRYGTARIAVKLSSIRTNGIFFNQCFGGGTEHSHGEDNLFLKDCIKKGLNVYAVPQYIAELTGERKSTWNIGYGDIYFKDQGCLYRTISRKYWKILCVQDAIRHYKLYSISPIQAYKKMTNISKKK